MEAFHKSQRDLSDRVHHCEVFNFQHEIVAKGKAKQNVIFSTGDDPIQLCKIWVSLILDPHGRLFGSKLSCEDVDLPKSIKCPAQFMRFV